MNCECCESDAEHEAVWGETRATYLAQYEAERRMGMIYHCEECVREARGDLLAESCRLCPPGRHRACEAHR